MSERMLSIPVPAPGPAGDSGRVVELGDVVRVVHEQASYPMFRRDGHFAVLVTGDALQAQGVEDIAIAYAGQPKDESTVTLLWDGE